MTATTQVRPGPPTPPASSAPGRRRDIQGLRAIAVLLVVVFHAELPVPGGFVGVDVFFVISGFVITAMLMREWARYGRVRFGHFYFRRFLRLTPALALIVAVVALASILLQNPFGAQQTTARTGMGAMLLSANYVIGHAAGDYFADNATTNPLLHTWSLSVEEQFYLVFPALLVLAWLLVRRGRRQARGHHRHRDRAGVVRAGSRMVVRLDVGPGAHGLLRRTRVLRLLLLPHARLGVRGRRPAGPHPGADTGTHRPWLPDWSARPARSSSSSPPSPSTTPSRSRASSRCCPSPEPSSSSSPARTTRPG